MDQVGLWMVLQSRSSALSGKGQAGEEPQGLKEEEDKDAAVAQAGK